MGEAGDVMDFLLWTLALLALAAIDGVLVGALLARLAKLAVP